MSRIRTIKPEFWADEKLATVSRDARLLFIGIWTFADDYGVCRAHPAYLKANVFPYEDDMPRETVARLADELANGGFVARFESQGETYVKVWGWDRHQRVDHPAKFRNPAPPEGLARVSRESRESVAPDHRPSTIDQDRRPIERPKAAKKAPIVELVKATPANAALVAAFGEVYKAKEGKAYRHQRLDFIKAAELVAQGVTSEEVKATAERAWRPGISPWLQVRNFTQLATRFADVAVAKSSQAQHNVATREELELQEQRLGEVPL